jgi:transposase InsO family protein
MKKRLKATQKKHKHGKRRISDAEILKNYHNPLTPGSFGGLNRFARENGIPADRVRKVLQKDLGYTLHRARRLKFPTHPVVVYGIDEQWCADLIEVNQIAKHNRGYRYLLTVIDVFSKHAWIEPLKNKTGTAVTAAFEKILRKGRTPINLQTDDGKEFYNKSFQSMLSGKGINHFSTSGDAKASVIERFNRTFKQKLYRYFTTSNTLSFVPVLQALVNGYNRTYHRSIKMAPNKVTLKNSPQVWKSLYGKKSIKRVSKMYLKVGDRVRLNKKFRLFKKSYLPGWTEEVFVVRSVRRGMVTTYKIEEWDGTPVKGTFYAQDLQKVIVDDNDIFRIEKIVKRRGDKVLVHWKGWPDKYDSWLEKHQVDSK